MSKYEIITEIVAVYGALLATYTLIIQIREKGRRLKVKLNFGFIEKRNNLGEEMLLLSGANTGHVEITLCSHAITLPGGTKIVFRQHGGEYQLPYTLVPSKSCTLWFPSQEIYQSLRDKGFSGKIKIQGVLQDQTGNCFKSNKLRLDLEERIGQ
jgi:hypothetical protein